MRTIPAGALLLAVALGACQRDTMVQPGRVAAPAAASHAAGVGKPEIDPSYANGQTVYMIGPRMIVGARETMPNAYAHAEELYLVVYPQETLPGPDAGPITLASGYRPQCNPCFHPGLPPMFVYHDHVLTGAPGMGKNGTAGVFEAPWKIILLVYNPQYVSSPTFTPVTSEADLDAAEQAGNVFLPINQGGANPYEVDTGNLLVCPLVSSHA